MTSSNAPLRRIVEMTREHWDQPTERETVRSNFQKVCACRTPALGAEVYVSATEERICYHTCKIEMLPKLRQSWNTIVAT